jgi:hypothetical protein
MLLLPLQPFPPVESQQANEDQDKNEQEEA